MKQIRRLFSLLLCLSLMGTMAAAAPSSRYTDVPAEHWAASVIEQAAVHGLMQGGGDGTFGLGNTFSRAEFVTVLSRMFGWKERGADQTFSDVTPDKWYYEAVELAVKAAVTQPGREFRPEAPITRGEMARMLVAALGYDQLAAREVPTPFADVSGEQSGTYALAYDIGMTNGVEKEGKLLFLPEGEATREEAAAMLVRVYERYTADIHWLHGFYAFSSYSQIDLTKEMDGVSVGWARLALNKDGTPYINSTAADDNEWVRPSGYADALEVFDGNGTPVNLNVFCSDADAFLTPEARTKAVAAVAAAAKGYAGITMDAEGADFKDEAVKGPYTLFMEELRSALPAEKSLYVCVTPDDWYKGYDYAALGEICDKVILMAHDYQWTSIPAYQIGTTQTENPLTPISKVYATLRSITHPVTGVADRSKIALQISFGSCALTVDGNKLLTGTKMYSPAPATIYTRLTQPDTEIGWSDVYQNPYAYYTTEEGSRYRLWYEDARSVNAKLRLARMFGINSVSLWRLGNIPAYETDGIDYNVWGDLMTRR